MKIWKGTILTNEFFCDRIKTKTLCTKKYLAEQKEKNGKKKNVIYPNY